MGLKDLTHEQLTEAKEIMTTGHDIGAATAERMVVLALIDDLLAAAEPPQQPDEPHPEPIEPEHDEPRHAAALKRAPTRRR